MINLKSLIAPHFYYLYWDIMKQRHSDYWLKGGRGSTKSSFISVMIILSMITDETGKKNAIVMRKNDNNLRNTVLSQYQWAIDKLGVSKYWHTSLSPISLTYVPTGAQILFIGTKDPERIKSIKFRKGGTSFKHFEELTEFNGVDTIRSINQSLDRGTNHVTTFYSYNPPASANNWVNSESENAKFHDDTLVDSSDYRSVPKDWLGPKFFARAEQLKKDNVTAYNHQYLGEVTGTGSEVFTNIKLEEITDEDISHFDHLYNGLDFGFANDPLAFVQMYYDKTRKKLYIFNELYRVGMRNEDAVREIKKFHPRYITSDREPRTVAEFQHLGLNVHPAKKGPDSRNQGYKWLQDLRAIIIDPNRCPNTSREFINYELEKNANGQFKNEYPDGNDHSIDASHYGMERHVNMRGGFRRLQ